MTISATTQGLRPGVCTSSNRPSAPFDGMMIYETDTNLVRIWNGTAWKTLSYSDYTNGSVLQVASTVKTDTFSTTSTTFTNITGLSATITPLSTTNKVLVVAQIGVSLIAASPYAGYLQITGGNASTFVGDAASSRVRASATVRNEWGKFESQLAILQQTIVYLDNPATTSATTYQIQARISGSGTTMYVNQSGVDTNDATYGRTPSTITVMEIAA